MLIEARRVLRPGGRLALDAMNRLRGNPRSRNGQFCMIDGRPAYMEDAVRDGLQVRWIHWLAEESPLVKLAEKERRPDTRPRNLRKYVTSVERYEGRLFRPHELLQQVQRAGFKEVKIVPLGHLAYILGSSDRKATRVCAETTPRPSENPLGTRNSLPHGNGVAPIHLWCAEMSACREPSHKGKRGMPVPPSQFETARRLQIIFGSS